MLQDTFQKLDRQALGRAVLIGIGLTVAANTLGYLLYLILRGGTLSPTVLSMPLALNGFLLFLYLAYGAAYVTFAAKDAPDGVPPEAGALGGGLVGLIVSLLSVGLSAIIIAVILGPSTFDVIREGLLDSGLGSVGGLSPVQTALLVIGGGSLGMTLFSIIMSAVSGALYAASLGPDGYYAGYEPPRWWR
jgi:hypothetical protein